MAPFTSASLYVGDLHPDVTETLLFEIFKQVGAVASIRVCRDTITRRSLGYAYVNFHTVTDAEHALETLNFTLIKNRPCRIMWSYRDPSIRKSGLGNVFIKNLHKSIDNKTLYDTFISFGNILSCKVVTDENGVSRGYGFVHYERQEEAEQAISKVNNMLLSAKQVFVGHFIPKKEKSHSERFTNVYVKNLDPSIDESELKIIFSQFGTITQAVIMRENGSSRGFGFVNFSHPDEAKAAVTEMSGKELHGKLLYAGKAQKKSEREAELKLKFEQLRIERINRYQGVNLYIKNLDDTIDDEKLRAEFSSFGNITSAKVMRDDKDNSRGFGFVCFSTPEEATRAVTEMNGRIFVNKPLYVALAQKREVRRAQLELQHKQAQANLAARAGLGNPLYTSPATTGAPVFYPPGAPLPPNSRNQSFMYPQQIMSRPSRGWTSQNQPTTRPGAYQGMPNYGVPVPPRSRPSRQRGGQTQVVGSGNGRGAQGGGQGVQTGAKRGFKYTPNARNPPQSGLPISQPNPNLSSQPLGPDVPGTPLSIPALAAANQEERKQLLGETLFPLIAVHEPQNAGKITGMLLESLDWHELIHLIESTETLLSKINEARSVLQSHAEQEGDSLDAPQQ
eukprot:TRINITY_DN1229_c0_g6_i1.p1 TRINITY_DN1229_c0_g6~~TRINITY_DN1229_c0_g6_i1.p1  ORF type:complete len:620 (+),score=132.34 TRINITY_DN1229_c0_g6_i1:142-2001(+)